MSKFMNVVRSKVKEDKKDEYMKKLKEFFDNMKGTEGLISMKQKLKPLLQPYWGLMAIKWMKESKLIIVWMKWHRMEHDWSNNSIAKVAT